MRLIVPRARARVRLGLRVRVRLGLRARVSLDQSFLLSACAYSCRVFHLIHNLYGSTVLDGPRAE